MDWVLRILWVWIQIEDARLQWRQQPVSWWSNRDRSLRGTCLPRCFLYTATMSFLAPSGALAFTLVYYRSSSSSQIHIVLGHGICLWFPPFEINLFVLNGKINWNVVFRFFWGENLLKFIRRFSNKLPVCSFWCLGRMGGMVGVQQVQVSQLQQCSLGCCLRWRPNWDRVLLFWLLL